MRTPRTAWERFNRAKTDSGWLLLTANLAMNFIFGGLFLSWAISATAGARIIFGILTYVGFAGVLKTGYVMVCVARGKTGRLESDNTNTVDASSSL